MMFATFINCLLTVPIIDKNKTAQIAAAKNCFNDFFLIRFLIPITETIVYCVFITIAFFSHGTEIIIIFSRLNNKTSFLNLVEGLF